MCRGEFHNSTGAVDLEENMDTVTDPELDQLTVSQYLFICVHILPILQTIACTQTDIPVYHKKVQVKITPLIKVKSNYYIINISYD